MLEARVRGAGVHEERKPELPHVAETLKRWRIDELLRERIEADVVPEWVADDLCHCSLCSRDARGRCPLAVGALGRSRALAVGRFGELRSPRFQFSALTSPAAEVGLSLSFGVDSN